MSAAARGLDPTVLEVERMLHASPVARVGSFRCTPTHPLFADCGPTRNHIFVFPRTAVVIERDDGAFVSTPQNVNLYNRGQAYSRRQVSSAGDICDFFAVAPPVLLEVLRTWDPSVEERPDHPFTVATVPLPTELFVRERTLVSRLRSALADTLEGDEAVIWLLDGIARTLLAKRPEGAMVSRSARDVVEYAKGLLARRTGSVLSIAEIAAAAGVSLYHLCRIFRRETGMTMSRYRLQLRLRLAFDRVPGSTDLLETALQLGFPSHAYFTHAFGTAFGITPSELRRRTLSSSSLERRALSPAQGDRPRAPRRRRQGRIDTSS